MGIGNGVSGSFLGRSAGQVRGFLIAGVSDFYIPVKSSAEHIAKVSSRLIKFAKHRN